MGVVSIFLIHLGESCIKGGGPWSNFSDGLLVIFSEKMYFSKLAKLKIFRHAEYESARRDLNSVIAYRKLFPQA